MYVCMYVCMHVFMYVCIYVCRYVGMYVYIHICIYIYIHTHLIYVCMYMAVFCGGWLRHTHGQGYVYLLTFVHFGVLRVVHTDLLDPINLVICTNERAYERTTCKAYTVYTVYTVYI